MKFKLIDKYIFNQIFGASFVCIALFMIVWIAPETLVNIIKAVSVKTMTVSEGLKCVLFSMPLVLSKALPVGIFLGCLYSFDRMSKDSELTVIRGCGINFWRILVIPILLGIVFAVLCFFVSDRMVPFATKNLYKIRKEVQWNHFVYALKDENNNMLQLILLKQYDTQDNKSDLIVLNFNRKNISKISILSDIIISKKVVMSDLKWDLYNNTQYVIKYDGVFEDVKYPEKLSILYGKKAQITQQLMKYNLKRDRELTNKELKKYLRILKDEEINDLYNLNLNFYLQRFFHSAMCIIFAILGCLLGYSNPREQRLIGFTIAIGIIFLYFMSLPFFNLMAEKQILSPYITASIQPIAAGFLIYFYKKYKGL
ncbi:LptF/LptG family permease [bacterium]|nr:LptF/LptG family permease [bacterium]